MGGGDWLGAWVLTPGAGAAGPVKAPSRKQTDRQSGNLTAAWLFDNQIMLHSVASLFSEMHSFCVALRDVPR